jgi:hypothetical protein
MPLKVPRPHKPKKPAGLKRRASCAVTVLSAYQSGAFESCRRSSPFGTDDACAPLDPQCRRLKRVGRLRSFEWLPFVLRQRVFMNLTGGFVRWPHRATKQ